MSPEPREGYGNLLVTRHAGESIIIGEKGDIIVSFLGFDNDGKVRIGIAAPRHIRIEREEIVGKFSVDRTPKQG